MCATAVKYADGVIETYDHEIDVRDKRVLWHPVFKLVPSSNRNLFHFPSFRMSATGGRRGSH